MMENEALLNLRRLVIAATQLLQHSRNFFAAKIDNCSDYS